MADEEFLVEKPEGYVPTHCPPIKEVKIENVLKKYFKEVMKKKKARKLEGIPNEDSLEEPEDREKVMGMLPEEK